MGDNGGVGRAHVRPVRSTRYRMSKAASASETIRGFGRGMDVAGLTFGQFSLLDLMHAVIEVTGPADVSVGTWSVGLYDVDAVVKLLESGRIRRIRFVVDAASMKTGQAAVTDLISVFGEDAVRSTRNHSKFIVLENDEWNVVVTASMNLNLNQRIEQFAVTDDADRAALFRGFVDEVFAEVSSSSRSQKLPDLRGMDVVVPDTGVSVSSRSIKVGVFRG